MFFVYRDTYRDMYRLLQSYVPRMNRVMYRGTLILLYYIKTKTKTKTKTSVFFDF